MVSICEETKVKRTLINQIGAHSSVCRMSSGMRRAKYARSISAYSARVRGRSAGHMGPAVSCTPGSWMRRPATCAVLPPSGYLGHTRAPHLSCGGALQAWCSPRPLDLGRTEQKREARAPHCTGNTPHAVKKFSRLRRRVPRATAAIMVPGHSLAQTRTPARAPCSRRRPRRRRRRPSAAGRARRCWGRPCARRPARMNERSGSVIMLACLPPPVAKWRAAASLGRRCCLESNRCRARFWLYAGNHVEPEEEIRTCAFSHARDSDLP